MIILGCGLIGLGFCSFTNNPFPIYIGIGVGLCIHYFVGGK